VEYWIVEVPALDVFWLTDWQGKEEGINGKEQIGLQVTVEFSSKWSKATKYANKSLPRQRTTKICRKIRGRRILP